MKEENKEFWEALAHLVQESRIVIDRPKGTEHPSFPGCIYKVDYGYLESTTSMDGRESMYGLEQTKNET